MDEMTIRNPITGEDRYVVKDGLQVIDVRKPKRKQLLAEDDEDKDPQTDATNPTVRQ